MKIDLLFRDARVYNVYIRRWVRQDVAVLGEKILYTGTAGGHGFIPDRTVECSGRPLIPGMIDIHLHIESTLCSPVTFGRAVLARGITTVVSEPHEIANVFGLEGIEEMIRVSAGSPADIFYGVPSSVPSTSPDLETTGGEIRPGEAEDLFRRYREVICLGEVMNYPSLIRMEKGRTTRMINAVRGISPLAAVEGHCPSIRDLELAKVLYAGVDSDHCLQDPEGMKQRFENGMFVEIQEKSVTPEIVDVLKGCHSEGLYCFVTDDVPPDILMKDGHLDHIVRKALKLGLPLEQAVAASSWAPACRMGFRDRGAVSPGKLADLLLLEDDSSDFRIRKVFRRGREIAAAYEEDIPQFEGRFKESLRLSEEDVRDEMFILDAPAGTAAVTLRVMEKNRENTYTREGAVELPVRDRKVCWERSAGNLVIVADRYSGKAGYARGFMQGCYILNGAVATTYAHDHHNLLAAGDNRGDMELAMKWVIRHQGGICVVSGGMVAASMALPVGGILSEEPISVLAERIGGIGEAMRRLGFEHPNPLMSFCTLTLPVSPALKITDRGLVRTGDGSIQGLYLF